MRLADRKLSARPADEMPESPIASEEDYSLTIVGKHGRIRIEGALVGSTGAAVGETARRRVLMVQWR